MPYLASPAERRRLDKLRLRDVKAEELSRLAALDKREISTGHTNKQLKSYHKIVKSVNVR